jgi:hypothetical protein
MSRMQSPRIIDRGETTYQVMCECCEKRAKFYFRAAYSNFRGEDDFHYVCGRHYKMAFTDNKMDQMFAHMRSKAKYMESKETISTPDTKP